MTIFRKVLGEHHQDRPDHRDNRQEVASNRIDPQLPG